ncbi:MAG: glycosyltransferase family 4 protein [bacterium]
MNKVLFLKFPIHSSFGGGEIHTLQLAKALPAKNVKIYLASSCLVLLKEFAKRKYPHQKVWGGFEPVTPINLILFTITYPFVLFKTYLYLKKYKQKLGIKTIYCQVLTEKLLATWVAKKLGLKVVWIEHLRIERWLLKNPYLFLYKKLSRSAKVVAVSEAIGNQLEKLGLNRKNIEVIYNGISLNKFSDDIKKQDNLDKVVIGTACRLAYEKGIDVLLNSFAKLYKDNKNVLLKIAGDGPEKENLIKLANRLQILEQVEFVGQVDRRDISHFFANLDIVALLSRRRESFGLTAAEAQSLGKPVVATAISGLKEVVKNNETGIVVPIDNVDEAYKALQRLTDDAELRDRFGQMGRKRVAERFSLEKMINKFYLLFTNK